MRKGGGFRADSFILRHIGPMFGYCSFLDVAMPLNATIMHNTYQSQLQAYHSLYGHQHLIHTIECSQLSACTVKQQYMSDLQ